MSARRVWEIFPQLSGDSQRERLVGIFRIYADESGKGASQTFIMAGLVARAEQWAEFEQDWQELLYRDPPIEYFHTKDRFYVKDFERITSAANVIKKYGFDMLAVVIYMPDYNALIRGKINKRLDSPYFFSLMMFIELAIQW